jgi:hypothetical protein
MLEELQAQKWLIVSRMFLDEFIAFCNERGVYPSGGRIIYEENAQFVYL